MPGHSTQMPLSNSELRELAAFARWVDQCDITEEMLRAAKSLHDVIALAVDIGFCNLTIDLLIRATNHLETTGWVWKRTTSHFHDHLYILSLVILLERPIRTALLSAQNAVDQPAAGNSPSRSLTSSALRMPQPTTNQPTAAGMPLAQALEIVRAHGYLPVKPNTLLDALTSEQAEGKPTPVDHAENRQ
jgi:hypothetical protein